MTLLLALTLLGWCIVLSGAVVACVALPMAMMGHRVPVVVLGRMCVWGGAGLLFVLWAAKMAASW